MVQTEPRRTLVERLVEATLDRDGRIYGDERERLRWYEGIAGAASVQWILVPWVLAVMAWVCDRSTAPYLWILYGVFVAPTVIVPMYARRRAVVVDRSALRTRKVRLLQAQNVVQFFVFIGGLTVGLDLRTDGEVPVRAVVGGLIGGVVGGALATVVAIVARRRQADADPAQD